MNLRNKVLLCFCMYALSCRASSASQFIPLGFLDSRFQSSSAAAVDATGHAVVGQSYLSNGQSAAFIWQEATGIQSLEMDNGAFIANAITPDGQTIVGRASTPRSFGESFLTNGIQGFTVIPNVPALGYPGSGASDVSADGTVLAGWSSTDSKYFGAYRWTEQDGYEELGELPGAATNTSFANAISPDGNVIVGVAGWPSQQEAFRWSPSDGMVGLGDLPGGYFYSDAYDVSENGRVIVGTSSSARASSSRQGFEAFRWEQTSGMVGLGFVSTFPSTSVARSVTPDGSVIVGTSGEYNLASAFVWDSAHGMRSLQTLLNADAHLIGDLTGWNLTYANAISANGQAIVGYGVNPQGNNEAYLVLLDAPLGVPESNSLATCTILCVISLGTVRQRRANRYSPG